MESISSFFKVERDPWYRKGYLEGYKKCLDESLQNIIADAVINLKSLKYTTKQIHQVTGLTEKQQKKAITGVTKLIKYEDHEQEYFNLIEQKEPTGIAKVLFPIVKEEVLKGDFKEAIRTVTDFYSKGHSAAYISKWTDVPIEVIEATIKGKRGQKYDYARTLQELGFSLEEVSKHSGISLEEIKNL